MKSAHHVALDYPPAPEAPPRLASWYAPGLSDGIGDRVLMFDNSSAPSLELLRFRPALSAAPGFELALRQRVERLRQFRHPSFAQVRSIETVDEGEGLALVSNHIQGKRLSDVLHDAQGPEFAIALIRQLTPALALLQQQGQGVAHGALAVDRVVLTPEGRLVIVEHVLGAAIDRLHWPADRLWTDLGIAVPKIADTRPPRLDARSDVVQLALIAVALLLGRRLRPEEAPHNLGDVLERFANGTGQRSSASFPPLRRWLERALQLDGRVFGSARDAQDGLDELPHARHSQASGFSGSFLPAQPTPTISEPSAIGIERAGEEAVLPTQREAMPAFESSARLMEFEPEPRSARPVEAGPKPRLTSAGFDYRPDGLPTPASRPAKRRPVDLSIARASVAPQPPRHPAMRRTAPWVTVALALLVIAEGVVIGGLVYARTTAPAATITFDSLQPGVDVVVDGRVAGVTPLKLTVDSNTRSVRVLSAEASAATPSRASNSRETGVQPASKIVSQPIAGRPAVVAKTSGLNISSPFALQVMEGGRLLGTSGAGAIVTTPGEHQFDLVNSALGYRSREVVTVRPGQTASLKVTPPNGRVNINALPWAEVWIDGKLAGETPLGNLSVPLGEHDIVFRHPQLGERRQTAVVGADAVTRVIANLKQ